MKSFKSIMLSFLIGAHCMTPMMIQADSSFMSAFFKPLKTVFWDCSTKWLWKPIKWTWNATSSEVKGYTLGALATWHVMCYVKRMLWSIAVIENDLHKDEYLYNFKCKVDQYSTPAQLNDLLQDAKTYLQMKKEQNRLNVHDQSSELFDRIRKGNENFEHLTNFLRDLIEHYGCDALPGMIKTERVQLYKYADELRYYTQVFSSTRYLPQQVRDMLLSVNMLDDDLRGSDGCSLKDRLPENCTYKRIQEVKNAISSRVHWHAFLCPSYRYAARTYVDVLVRLKRLDMIEKIINHLSEGHSHHRRNIYDIQ